MDDPFEEHARADKARAEARKQRIGDIETAFYNTFKSTDGKIVLQFLREQLQIEDGSISLTGRDNPTINAQRDAMKLVYWMIWRFAEGGANRKGDTLVRNT